MMLVEFENLVLVQRHILNSTVVADVRIKTTLLQVFVVVEVTGIRVRIQNVQP